MGLLDLDLKEAGNDFINRLKDPFDRFFAPPLDMKGALERNDFKQGFNMVEIVDGKELSREKVQLLGDSMPHIPFGFGGVQKLVKDYYPGNTEPTVQVLGPRENDITIRGRLKSKNLTASQEQRESFRGFAQELQQLIEAMRIRGNLIRMYMGEFQRFGFLEEANFQMRTIADIDYEIKFSIIGFNPPSDCKVIDRSKNVPFDINKDLIAQVGELQALQGQVPDALPRSLSDQLNDAISDVAGAINLVTGFVDTVLNEVDSIKASISRAEGLIKNARATLSSFQRRVGAFSPTGGAPTGAGISAGYTNAAFITSTLSFSFSLTALLAALSTQLQSIALTEPIARHRVQSGDTLQRLAVKFYDDGTQWKEIYDHNKLTSVDLEIGAILEIPRIE